MTTITAAATLRKPLSLPDQVKYAAFAALLWILRNSNRLILPFGTLIIRQRKVLSIFFKQFLIFGKTGTTIA